MPVLTCGSLFAGVGGFDIAAERAGMEVAWQSEVDKHASAVLEHHWPGRNLGDIHDLQLRPCKPERRRSEPDQMGDSADAAGRRNEQDALHLPRTRTTGEGTDGGIRTATGVDVLCGGFPCQDYSVAGNREGLAGDRGALWWEFHRLIREGRPTWVIGENVPGLLSSRNGEDFATIIESLTELGYGVVWAVLDAQYFNVPQRRRRVFIVGHSGGQPRPEILALSEGLFGHPAPSRETRERVAASVSTRVASGSDDHANGNLVAHPGDYAVGSHGSGDYTGTVTTTWAKGPGNTQVEEGALVAEGPQVRRLTPLECERLQGFPDGWTDIPGNSDTQRYRQMGNAVAVPVVEWIMKRIADGQD